MMNGLCQLLGRVRIATGRSLLQKEGEVRISLLQGLSAVGYKKIDQEKALV